MAAARLRVALADDQALVRRGLRALMETMDGLEVAAEAEDGLTLLAALLHIRVDVILCDIRMPRCSGIDVVKSLRKRGDCTPVLLLTTFDEPNLLRNALDAGACGYLLKDAEPDDLRAAIRQGASGRTFVAPVTANSAKSLLPFEATRLTHLTEREKSVLRLVASGLSNKEIGRVLQISDGTVKNHITEILAKLNARDRTHAVLKAIASSLL